MNTIEKLGEEETFRNIVERSITEFEDSKIEVIGDFAFCYCSALTSISIPAATSIGNSAFQYCSKLTSVEFPLVTSIINNAFYKCSALTSVSFPVATSIGNGAFSYCNALTSVSFPAATSIGNGVFQFCEKLTSIDFPLVTSMGLSAFYSCSALTSVALPVATSIGISTFEKCSALTSVSFPVATSIGESAFSECRKLTTMYIGTKSDTVCTLSSTNAIPSNVTDIYVPTELVDSYKTATNWSKFASKIQGYEVPVSCQSLTITADDVPGYKTSTKIHYEAVCTYSIEGMMQTGTKTFTGTAKSDTFGKNPSKESPRQIEISYTFLGQTATTTITQGVDVDRTMEVTTSGIATYGWVTASSTYNVDGYDAYMSDSKGKSSSQAVMKITCTGYSELTLYIRSYAEGSYDYTIASKANVSNYPTSSTSTDTLSHTKSHQTSGTTLSNYTAVDYTGLTGNDTIYIVFVKDSSGNEGDDRGFVLIPQE